MGWYELDLEFPIEKKFISMGIGVYRMNYFEL